jgi:nicotinamide riboside kinase
LITNLVCLENAPVVPVYMKEFILEDLNDFESVTYSEWTTVDRTTLITVQQSAEDFVLKLVSLLLKLRTHNFL